MGENKKKREDRSVVFWNVAGLGKKDEEFWEFIGKHDFISLSETWLEEKNWEGIKGWLPDSHVWEGGMARKEKKRGRAMGGMLVGKRKEWGAEGDKLKDKEKEEIIRSEIVVGKEKWVIILMYNRKTWKEMEQRIDEIIIGIEESENVNIIIGGDFNIRIEDLGSVKELDIKRKSKNRIIGNGGRNLVEWIRKKGWYVLNGACEGDWDGNFTYVGARGNTVIDFVIVNEAAYNKVIDFKILERVDSDHLPLQLRIRNTEEGKKEERRRKKREERRAKIKEIIVWDEEAIKKYKEKTEALVQEFEQEEGSVEERWQWIKKTVLDAMIRRKIRIRKRKIGFKDWWDRECTRRKRKVQRCFCAWRRGKIGREELMEEKGKLRKFIEEKQKEKREKEENELREIRKETEVWRYINRKRGRKMEKENDIEEGEWREHFKELLGGSEIEGEEEKMVQEREWRIKENGDIQDKEIWEVVRRMKKRKAVGIDGIPMEAWIYAGKDLRSNLVILLKKVWKDNEIPEDWRKSIVVPLYKRGDKNVPSNYRGISLLCTAYKILAEVIRKRLEEETERRRLLPETQASFRRGRSTLDNIYVLSHMVQRGRNLEGKERKIYAFFADLRAAFDNVDREILWKILEEKGIEEGLLRRIERIYERTEISVRTNNGLSRSFRTGKGVRQGCALSPLLFNLYMAGIDEMLNDREIGGIEIGRNSICGI